MEDAIRRIAQAPAVVLDTETTGLAVYGRDRIVGVAVLPVTLAGEALGEPSYFPFRHASDNLPENLLKPLVQAINRKPAIFFNSRFDLPMLEKEGYVPPPPHRLDDALLSAHLLNENEESFQLKQLGVKYVSPDAAQQQKELDKLLGGKKGHISQLPGGVVAGYAKQDVVLTAALYRLHEPALSRWKLDSLYDDVMRYSETTRAMERFGLPLDLEALKALRQECFDREVQLEEQIRTATGQPELNLLSAPQLARALGVLSTAEEYLAIRESIGSLSPEKLQTIRLLQEWRAWRRTRRNYCDALEDNLGTDGRSHASFLLHGTISGRLSCRKPPLQAIPAPEENSPLGRVRDLFRASPGKVIINADYSQAELRVLAHYTKDEAMHRLYAEGADLHGETARELGIPRDVAKRIGFGVVYGLGARGLSQRMFIPLEQARRYMSAYHKARPGVRDLMETMETQAQHRGYIRLWTGRVRRYKDQDPHKAMSNLIQGGVAEIVRVAISRLHGLPMSLQVHDSIMFEVDRQEAPDLCRFAKQEMERDFPFTVPPVVDIEFGPSWGTLQKGMPV